MTSIVSPEPRPTPLLSRPDDEGFASALASILLVAGGPVSFGSLSRILDLPRSQLPRLVSLLRDTLPPGVTLQVSDREVQLATAPENAAIVQKFLGTEKVPPISRAATEALTVIAYRQPVTRAEIEALRGVNSDRAVQTLLGRGLVEERGRRESVGRPMQYGTTFAFLEYFGLSSLDDLPALPDEEIAHVDAGMLGMRNGSAEQPTEPQ